MPVGSRSSVWTSHSCSSFRRTVSPAPPSKSTLSGTTTAARPLIVSSVRTCWTKLSCLFDVDAQKSSRTTTRSSRPTSPSSFTNVIDDLLPNGGFVSTIVESLARVGLERVVDDDGAFVLLVADPVQEEVHDAQARRVVDDLPAVQCLVSELALLVGVELMVSAPIHSCAASRKPPVPQAGSQIAHARLRLHHLDDGPDQRTRREVLAGARLHVLGVLLEQPLVGVALDIGVEREPLLAVDQVDDRAAAAWPGPGSGSAPCGRRRRASPTPSRARSRTWR